MIATTQSAYGSIHKDLLKMRFMFFSEKGDVRFSLFHYKNGECIYSKNENEIKDLFNRERYKKKFDDAHYFSKNFKLISNEFSDWRNIDELNHTYNDAKEIHIINFKLKAFDKYTFTISISHRDIVSFDCSSESLTIQMRHFNTFGFINELKNNLLKKSKYRLKLILS